MHPSTAFQTLLLTMMATPFLLREGLDLIDRVPDIVQETGIKTIPMENKCTKEALQIAVKRREAKSKGEKIPI